MQLERRKLTDLIPAGYNPRRGLRPGDSEYEKIKTSIAKFGYVDPIIINSDNTIIGGHQRATVLMDMGHVEVDVVLVNLDKQRERALNLALNKVDGVWDELKLAELLNELKAEDYNLAITGFDATEVDQLMQYINFEQSDIDQQGDLSKVGDGETKNIKCPACGHIFGQW